MNVDQVKQILKLVAANDGRTTGEADAVVWSAAIADLEFADAQAAVLDHVRDGDGWLTPAMVRQAATAKARRRAFEQRQAELGGPPGFCGVPGCDCTPQAPRPLDPAFRQALDATFRRAL